MPHTWTDLRDESVAILGLGVEGQATARKLTSLGIPFSVIDTDMPATSLEAISVVIKSPGIPPSAPIIAEIARRKIAVTTGLDLWLHSLGTASRVVLVTGTKGKSTTASLLAFLLESLGHSVVLGGNIGLPPWDPMLPNVRPDVWVIEASSYQAAGLTISAPLVLVTSLSPDHIPWHGSVEQYIADKLSICTKPGHEWVVANGCSRLLLANERLLGSAVTWVTLEDPNYGIVRDSLKAPGDHNVSNALLCIKALDRLGVDYCFRNLEEALARFRPLSHRLEEVARFGDVLFVDDTLSTNALSASAALSTYQQPVALIVGGQDRGIDYTALAEAIQAHGCVHLIGIPDNGDSIIDCVRGLSSEESVLSWSIAPSLREAVDLAYGAIVRTGGVVLLSPAAPSFNAYANYEAKSSDFMRSVEELRVRLRVQAVHNKIS